MDPVRNPYVPGAGTPPPELAGRAVVLSRGETALKRVALGKSTQSVILVGLRGVGKTVLLVRLNDVAEGAGFKTILVEANENKTLPALLIPGLRRILFSLDLIESAKAKSKKALRVLRSFVSSLKITINDQDVGMSIEPENGVADSGDLENDLSELLLAVADAARAASKPVAIFLDELQYLSREEFGALIMALHKINQQKLPLILIGAGLPRILGLAGDSKSYAERLFQFPSIGALEEKDALAALVNPAQDEGVRYSRDAVQAILSVTERYPYFLQQWGHEAWNLAKGPEIDLEDVGNATSAAIKTLDDSFFKVRFDRCTPSERRYMRALAELGPGHHRSGDIADILRLKITSVAPTRSKLIIKGMIYSLQHGDTAFTVPLFDGYMRRVMPLSA